MTLNIFVGQIVFQAKLCASSPFLPITAKHLSALWTISIRETNGFVSVWNADTGGAKNIDILGKSLNTWGKQTWNRATHVVFIIKKKSKTLEGMLRTIKCSRYSF